MDQRRNFGTTRRGWLSGEIQQVTDEIAESLGLSEAHGALVAGVLDNSPAEAAKMKEGDVILKFNGRNVNESRKLPRIVADTEVGKTVKVVVWRAGKKITLNVTLGELEKFDEVNAPANIPEAEPAVPEERTFDELGLSLSTITPALAAELGLDDGLEGVIITNVDGASAAAENGLRQGDVITEVFQEKVLTPDAVAAKIKDARSRGLRSILLTVRSGDDQRFVGLRIDGG
jgi:serine protease Do